MSQNERDPAPTDERVLPFRQWCELNSISVSTGRRLLKAGKGPNIRQLSDRRIGVTLGDNRRWQQSRERK
jgi:hypothetical protein